MKKELSENQLQLRLRKTQSDLAASGLGVIAFGVWSVIKPVLTVALDPESYLGAFEGDRHMLLAFWIMLGGAMTIDLALRVYVGLSAIVEGRGKKKKTGYIVLAPLMALASFLLLAVGLYVQGFSTGIGSTLITLIVELTSDVLLLGLSISAVRIKRLSRILTGAES